MRYSSSFAPQSSWRNAMSKDKDKDKEKEGREREGREREGRSRESKSIFSSQDDDEGGIGGRDLPPPPPPPLPRARTFAEYFQTPATERSIINNFLLLFSMYSFSAVYFLLLVVSYELFSVNKSQDFQVSVWFSCHAMSCHVMQYHSIFYFLIFSLFCFCLYYYPNFLSPLVLI